MNENTAKDATRLVINVRTLDKLETTMVRQTEGAY